MEEKLSIEIRRLPLEQLRHLEVNARYMTSDQQQRLTANVKRDGALTRLPLVWLMQAADGTPTETPAVFEILSGNHRVVSAREAGLVEIDCIVVTNYLTRERRIELQLSHNAISGQDDLSTLEQLYEQLTLSGKEYSGLTDDLFASLKDISLPGFSVGGPAYEEISLTFLPEDAAEFSAALDRFAKAKKVQHHLASLASFNPLFDTIVRLKELKNVQNNAVAIILLAELAAERLDQLEAEARTPDAPNPDEPVLIEEPDPAGPEAPETHTRVSGAKRKAA